jgi:hypothetical protein
VLSPEPADIGDDLPDWLNEISPAEQPGAPAPDPTSPSAFAEDAFTGDGIFAPADPDLPDWLQDDISPVDALGWDEETPQETQAKFTRDLASLPAMQADFAAQLRAAGVGVVAVLLKKGADADARRQLAQRADVDESELTTWVRLLDMLRVRNLTVEHVLLLDGVGISGLPELAQANAANLTAKLSHLNQEAGLLKQPPPYSLVEYWIKQAGEMQLIV